MKSEIEKIEIEKNFFNCDCCNEFRNELVLEFLKKDEVVGESDDYVFADLENNERYQVVMKEIDLINEDMQRCDDCMDSDSWEDSVIDCYRDDMREVG